MEVAEIMDGAEKEDTMGVEVDGLEVVEVIIMVVTVGKISTGFDFTFCYRNFLLVPKFLVVIPVREY